MDLRALSISIMQSKQYLPHSGKLTAGSEVEEVSLCLERRQYGDMHLQVLNQSSAFIQQRLPLITLKHTWQLFFLYLHFFKSLARALLHYLKYTEKRLLTLKLCK